MSIFTSCCKHEVHKELLTLSDAVHDLEECVPIFIEDDYFEPTITASHRLYLLSILALADPVQLIRYDSGGGSCVMHFIQKISENSTADSRVTTAVRMVTKIEPEIPVYHSRAMRKVFSKQLQSIHSCSIQPHILRHIYRELTGDASREISRAEIDQRVQLAIETDDPDLIIDLRHLNGGRHGDTFAVFFRELELVVEEVTAADDRRHGIAHMSEFLSITDLISQV